MVETIRTSLLEGFLGRRNHEYPLDCGYLRCACRDIIASMDLNPRSLRESEANMGHPIRETSLWGIIYTLMLEKDSRVRIQKPSCLSVNI